MFSLLSRLGVTQFVARKCSKLCENVIPLGMLLVLTIGSASAMASPTITGIATTTNLTDRVDVTVSGGAFDCTGAIPFTYVLYRDGTSVQTVMAVNPIMTDSGATPGVSHNYQVVLSWTNTGGCSTSGNSTSTIVAGMRAVAVAAPTGITAFTSGVNNPTISFTAPDQSASCTSVSYGATRNGVAIASPSFLPSAPPLTGGAGYSFVDLAAPPGLHNYALVVTCAPSGATAASASYSLTKYGTASAAAAVSASDGTYTDRVVVSFTGPNQTGQCSSVTYTLQRGSGGPTVDTTTLIPASGGAGTLTDLGVGVGVNSYIVWSSCSPGGFGGGSIADTGFITPTPYAPTGVTASDGPNPVSVSFTGPNQSGVCSAMTYQIYRDGVFLGNASSVSPLTGGAGGFSDYGPTPGSHSYYVNALCTSSGLSAASAADTGYLAFTPAAATGVTATDGTSSNQVVVSFTGPNQSTACTSISYVVTRDGVDIGTVSTVPLTGGAGNFTDTTMTAGTHAYGVRSVCTPGGNTAASATDSGYYSATPAAATGVSATDGTYGNQVVVSFTGPNQSTACTSISYVVTRDGVDIGTVSTVPLVGGAGNFTDTTMTAGSHSYGVRSVCAPGTGTANSLTDPGYANFAPVAATAVSATDGTYSNQVVVSFTGANQSATCTSISYVVTRDGVDIGTVSTVPLVGGAGNFTDTTMTAGSHSYGVRSVCAPGTGTANSLTDPGHANFAPVAATAVSATDGTYSNQVVVSFTGGNQSATCTSISYVVTRDGTDIGTVSTVPLTGGAGSFSDTTMSAGTHTYGVRSVCAPGTGTATSLTDPGYFNGTPAAVTAVSATDGVFSNKVAVTFTSPNQSTNCSSVSYVLVRDGVDAATSTTIPLTGGVATIDDLAASAGSHSYTVRSVCAPGTGTAVSTADPGYWSGAPLAVSALSATDGTYTNKVAVSFTAPDQSLYCTTTSYVIARDGVDITTVTTIPNIGGAGLYDDLTATAGTHNYTVRSVCSPGTGSTTTIADPGYWSGTPAAVSVLAASDGTFTDRVQVTFTGPNQSASCSTVSYVIVRDGADIGSVTTVPVAGGTGLFDDSAVGAGIHSYTIRSVCAPGTGVATSLADTGFRNPAPAVATMVTATDGTFTNKIAVSFTGPNQTALCTGISYVVVRDGVDVGTVSTVPVTGGLGSFDDLTASVGTHSYTVRSVCTPGTGTSVSAADTGYWQGTPSAPTLVTASDGAFATKIAITFTAPNQSAACTAASYVVTRDAVDLVTINTIPLAGGAGSFDDFTATMGTHTYGVRVSCQPGGATATSAVDTGFLQPSAPAPTGLAATDYTLTDRVTITATVPAAPNCTSRTVILARDGVDIATVATIPLTGGPLAYDDMLPAYGVHSYSARSHCDYGTGVNDSVTVSDPGAVRYPAPTCTSVDTATPTIVFTNSASMVATARGVAFGSMVRIRASAVAAAGTDTAFYTTTASASDYAGSIPLANHKPGAPEFGVFNVDAMVTGMNPGDTEQVCATTTFTVVQGCGVITVTGPQGTGPLPATISWTADPNAQQYILSSSPTAGGPFAQVGVYPAGQTTASVAGWPKEYFQVQCVAANPIGNSISAAKQIWGDPVPLMTGQTFPAGNPGTTSVTPSITDPDGNTFFTLAVVTPPVNGTVVINAGQFKYTPNANYVGLDPFTISATDPGGASVQGVFTANVSLTPPPMPTAVAATDGTRATDVMVTWDQLVGTATDFDVYAGASATDVAPVLVGSTVEPNHTFYDVAAPPGVIRWYSVVAKYTTAVGTASSPDSGLKDTPPINLAASGSVSFNSAVDLVPTVVDPDPGDLMTYAVVTQPANGTASIVAGRIRYAANGLFVGDDTFQISATDKAGQSVVGTAVVTVGCPAPLLNNIAVLPTRTFAGGGFKSSITYSTNGCPATYSTTWTLLSGTTVLNTQSATGVAGGQNLISSMNALAPATVGTYTAKFELTNLTTGEVVSKTGLVPVEVLRLSPIAWKNSTVVVGAEAATLKMGAMTQCTVTTDAVAAAASGGTMCLVELTGAPAEIAVDPSAVSGLAWTGVPSTAGTYPVVVHVSVFDVNGTKNEVASATATLTVAPTTIIAYNVPATLSVKQSLGVFDIYPQQTSGPSCPTALDVATAQTRMLTGARACLFTWTSASTDFLGDGVRARGVIYDALPVTVNWTLNMVGAGGTLIPLYAGSTVVTPTPVTLGFNLTVNPAGATALITPATVMIAGTGTDKCGAFTGNPTLASTSPSRPCLVEYGAVSGMALDPASSVPLFKGRLPTSPVTTVPYTVSMYFNGVKRLVHTGSQDLVTGAINPPAINIQYGRTIAPDVFAVSTTGGPIGVLTSDTAYGSISGQAAVQGATPVVVNLGGAKVRQLLLADTAPLYTSRSLDINLAFAADTNIASTKTVTVVSVPKDGLRLHLNSPSPTAADTVGYIVSATVQEFTPTGYQYNAANAGQWMVTFGELSLTGIFTPLSTPTMTDASGTVAATISVAGKAMIRLVAQATPVSGATGYTATLVSPTFVVSVVKGTPVSGTVQVIGSASGPSPYLAVMRAAFDTRADQLANKTVTWFQSVDGGVTWATPPGAAGIQYAGRFPPGDYMVRVQFENMNTGQTSFSPAITISSYNVPKIGMTGPTYLLPASTGVTTLTATDAANSPMAGAVFEWEMQKLVSGSAPTSVATGTTSTVTFTPVDIGIYRLVVKARDGTTNPLDTRAWATQMRQIIVGAPGKPAVRISGPVRLETGVSGSYTASVITAFDLASSNLTIGGQWTLPNGTVVPGATLAWTPSLADYAASKVGVLTYTTWVVGYEAATTSATTFPVTLWKYVWPTWSVAKSLTAAVAPANVQLTVSPNDVTLLSVLEGLTYQWVVPAGMTPVGTPTSKLVGTVNFAGTYGVTVTVSDARGNSTVLTDNVVLGNPPAIVLDLAAVNMSKWSHAPITVGLTTRPSGGHPLDAITSYKYLVDGVDQGVPSGLNARVNLTNPGTYVVEVQATSRLGATANRTATVVVPLNQAPTCGITGTVAPNRRSIALKSNCVDPDGAITRYAWDLNGTAITLSVGSVWTMILPVGVNLPVTVGLTVTDDGGATSTTSATFN